jgi:hypothetical protein
MQRLISAICAGLILGAGLVLAFAQPAENAQQKLQGTWTATKAERDGNAADDVVGHRLSFTGNRFQSICDNAPNLDEGRPVSFETKSGSGYELITFKRAAPDRA